MARPLRIEFKGALYHVTSRGNARQKIFFDDTDTRSERNAAIRIARERCGYSVSDIARHLELSIPTVSLISREVYHQK